MNVLVVAAHPDDEVLGCGGTVARLAQEGHHVYLAMLGEGITSRYPQREAADPELVQALHQRSRQVGEVMGAREVFLYGLPDNRFDTVPLLEVVKIIESLLEQLAPRVIFTHYHGDLNVDHKVVHRAVLTATRPMVGHCVKEVYAFEVLSSTEWAFQQFGPAFRPNLFVDVASTLENKVRAMELYESEARAFPHPRSPEAIRTSARRWGSVVGLEAAEAFEAIRVVRGPGERLLGDEIPGG